VARLAQVDVHVDEARTDDLPGGLDDAGARRRGQPGAELRDLSILQQKVVQDVDGVARIDDATTADQDAHAASALLLPASSKSTAMRTATPFAT
jgi:hypothetical protein